MHNCPKVLLYCQKIPPQFLTYVFFLNLVINIWTQFVNMYIINKYKSGVEGGNGEMWNDKRVGVGEGQKQSWVGTVGVKEGGVKGG